MRRPPAYWLPSALTGYLWLKGGHPGLPGLACPLRALTGIPCPTCFLTRATAASLRGDLSGAIGLHAFGPLAAAGLVAWSVLAIRRRRLLPLQLKPGPLGVLGASLLAYWGMRLVQQQVFGIQAFPDSALPASLSESASRFFISIARITASSPP